jgi:hypothetical protein
VLGDGVSYLFYGVGALIVEGEELDLSVLNRRLGGTVKMGEIIELVPDLADRNIKESIKKLLLKATKPFLVFLCMGRVMTF